MKSDDKIIILGGNGLVGSAIRRKLINCGFNNVMSPRSNVIDLTKKEETLEWFKYVKPDYVFMIAARVGGIQANINSPVDFGIINTEIINNSFQACHSTDVKKMLFFGSSCIYPKESPQPMKEEYLLTGPFEPTNELYALSKTYGIKLCQAYRKQYNRNYISCQPCNIYGPNDNFDPVNSHVVAATIRKFWEAKEYKKPYIMCWGDGSSRREFLHCDDLADVSLMLMNNYNESDLINVGCGYDVSIKELTAIVSKIVGYYGEIVWDTSRPNGIKQKLLDSSKIKNLGWTAKISLENGIEQTYKWFLDNKKG